MPEGPGMFVGEDDADEGPKMPPTPEEAGVTLTLTTNALLDNGSMDVIINEDTSGDGTADNSATQPVSGGVNSYTFSDTFEGSSGNDFWLEIQESLNSPTGKSELLEATISF